VPVFVRDDRETSFTSHQQRRLDAARPGARTLPTNSALVGQHLWIRRDKLPIALFRDTDLWRTAARHIAKLALSLDVIAAVIGDEPGGKDPRVLVKHCLHDEFVARKTHALRHMG
jgi:hypothetical protein